MKDLHIRGPEQPLVVRKPHLRLQRKTPVKDLHIHETESPANVRKPHLRLQGKTPMLIPHIRGPEQPLVVRKPHPKCPQETQMRFLHKRKRPTSRRVGIGRTDLAQGRDRQGRRRAEQGPAGLTSRDWNRHPDAARGGCCVAQADGAVERGRCRRRAGSQSRGRSRHRAESGTAAAAAETGPARRAPSRRASPLGRGPCSPTS